MFLGFLQPLGKRHISEISRWSGVPATLRHTDTGIIFRYRNEKISPQTGVLSLLLFSAWNEHFLWFSMTNLFSGEPLILLNKYAERFGWPPTHYVRAYHSFNDLVFVTGSNDEFFR